MLRDHCEVAASSHERWSKNACEVCPKDAKRFCIRRVTEEPRRKWWIVATIGGVDLVAPKVRTQEKLHQHHNWRW